jgi:MFS family permease
MGIRRDRPPHFSRNASVAIVDHVSFVTGMTFVGVTSVLPAFVRRLTPSSIMVGLVAALYYGGTLLPQALVARVIAGWPRKKPFASAALFGRVVFFVVGAALWTGGASDSGRMLAILLACLTIFVLTDGAAMVAWWDIIGRALPARARARIYGLAQAVGAVLGVAAGVLIGWVLSESGPAYPANYALLFVLAGLFFAPSTIALLLFREPEPEDPSVKHVIAQNSGPLATVLGDERFRRVVACRLLLGFVALAAPFYVGHAVDVLSLPEAAIGVFTIAQTAAVVAASLLFGVLGGRRGSRAVIVVASAVAIVSPLFALIAHLVGGRVFAVAYPIVFVGLGVVLSAEIVGFGNYVLQLAPTGLHGAYIGVGNTILGIQALAPVLGGWVLRSASYPLLFSLSALGILAAVLLAARLEKLPNSSSDAD